MAKTPAPAPRIRDLHPETRREIARQKAIVATETVKKSDAQVKIEQARSTIEKLKEGN